VVTFSRAGFIYLTTTLLLYFGRLKKGRSGIVLLALFLFVLMLSVDGFVARIGTIGDVKRTARPGSAGRPRRRRSSSS